MNVLVIDIGGSHVRMLATGQDEARKFASGRTMTPRLTVSGDRKLAKDWQYEVVFIGYPGPALSRRVGTA